MAGSLSNYAEAKILDHAIGKTSWTMPTAYLALYTAAPTDAGGGTEVTGGSYARVAIAANMAAATGTTPCLSTNSGQIAFPTATASWGTVVAAAILDASTAGNFIWWFDLTASKAVASGDTLVFNTGELDLTLD
jgi:hypothetical protein